ncbi:hypothetical protein [Micromonospora sp. NBC_01638]|uniref:hypothetical protein n=1 Tax=Micromonospora sp. NBC_01638 TaxID=2975982 RepID=UPI0038707187|nr:hypothetical protein OG811_12675 [Micromonospora sp. NBC_01638]
MMRLDGEPVTPEQLRNLALINYGHFTTMTVDGAGVRGLGLHLERLVRDCRTVLAADLDPVRVRELARQAAEDAGSPAIMRVTVFDPALDLGHVGKPGQPRILKQCCPATTAGVSR